YWPLERVKQLAAKRGGLFIMRERAMKRLTRVCPSKQDAYLFVRGVLCDTLAEEHFAGTVQLSQDTCDVYGLYLGDDPWYIKLNIDEEQPEVVVISFHEPEQPLQTRAGLV